MFPWARAVCVPLRGVPLSSLLAQLGQPLASPQAICFASRLGAFMGCVDAAEIGSCAMIRGIGALSEFRSALAGAIVQIWSASTGAGEQQCDPADLRHAGGDRKGPGRPDAGLILPGGTQPQEDHRHPHAQEPTVTARPMVLPSWMEWNTPEVPVSGTSHRPSAPSSPPESPSFGVVGQGRADQAELTHPRAVESGVGPSGRMWGAAGSSQ